MDEFVKEWNCHRICSSNMAEQPSGVPNEYPALHGMNIYFLKFKFSWFIFTPCRC